VKDCVVGKLLVLRETRDVEGFVLFPIRVKSNLGLLVAVTAEAALITLRTLNLWLTGFMTSDEANYILRAFNGMPYGTRYFFGYETIGFFRAFGIDSFSTFLILFPFYLAFWSFAFLILANKLVGLLVDNSFVRNLCVATIPFLITYSLLSVGFLAETPGLVMCTLGIYLWLLYTRRGQTQGYLLLLSSCSFILAAYSREPYLILPLLGILFWTIALLGKHVSIRHWLCFVIPATFVLLPQGPLLPFLQSTPLIVSAGVSKELVLAIGAHPGPVSGMSSLLASSASILPTMELFAVSLMLGWNPLLVLVAAFGLVLVLTSLKRQLPTRSILVLSFACLGTDLIVSMLFSSSANFYLGAGLSNLVRLSSTSVPAYLLLAPFAYQRLGKRGGAVALTILVLGTVLGAGAYSQVVQTNFGLPYNVIGFGNEFGPHEAWSYLMNLGSTSTNNVVFMASDWKAGQVYTYNLAGVLSYPTMQEEVEYVRANPAARSFRPDVVDALILHDALLELKPTTFYVLSPVPISPQGNESVGSLIHQFLGYSQPPDFLTAVYTSYYTGLPAESPTDGMTVLAVHLIFSSPSGHFLKVDVEWNTPS
jgi:hypothetical protein